MIISVHIILQPIYTPYEPMQVSQNRTFISDQRTPEDHVPLSQALSVVTVSTSCGSQKSSSACHLYLPKFS